MFAMQTAEHAVHDIAGRMLLLAVFLNVDDGLGVWQLRRHRNVASYVIGVSKLFCTRWCSVSQLHRPCLIGVVRYVKTTIYSKCSGCRLPIMMYTIMRAVWYCLRFGSVMMAALEHGMLVGIATQHLTWLV